MATPHVNSRGLYPAESNALGAVFCYLRVSIGGSGAPTVVSTDSPGVTITRTGTGAYTISTPDANNGYLVGAVAEPATAATRVWLAVPVTGRSGQSGTFPVIHWNGSAAADPASGDFVTFFLALNGSRV